VPKPQSRHLTPTEIKKIAYAGRGKQMAVLVIDAGGEEPNGFADEIRSALISGGVTVSSFTIESARPPFYGVQILHSSPAAGQAALKEALKSAGLEVDITNGMPPIPASIRNQFTGMTFLIVGLHPDLRMK
jgi:hypothetical protein